MAGSSKQDFGNSLDLVDIKEVKQNTVILKDGSLRHVIMVGGVNFALKSDMEQNIILQGYQNFLNSIDFPLQIVIHSRKVNIDRYADELMKRKSVEESPLLQNQIDEYTHFIRGFVEKNAIMEKTFLVVVPFYPAGFSASGSGGGIFSMFGGKKSDVKSDEQKATDAEKNFDANLAQLEQRTNQVMSGILGMGLEATRLENDALVELFYNFYNPQTIERQNVPLANDHA